MDTHQDDYETRAAWSLACRIDARARQVPVVSMSSLTEIKTIVSVVSESPTRQILCVRNRGSTAAPLSVMKLKILADSKQKQERSKESLRREFAHQMFANQSRNRYISPVKNLIYEFTAERKFGLELECFSLGDFSHISESMTEFVRLKLLADAERGLHYLHSLGIVHGDIKLQNMVVVATPGGGQMAKLIDFGATRVIGYLVTQGRNFGDTLCFRSPELWDTPGEPPLRVGLGPPMDQWCMGVAMLQLIMKVKKGTCPWHEAKTTDSHYKQFLRDNPCISEEPLDGAAVPPLRFRASKFKGVPGFVDYLIFNLLRTNPELRYPPLVIEREITAWLERQKTVGAAVNTRLRL